MEAYNEVLPTINTLRLCNRFGRGDHAIISKLPIELLSEIELYIIEDTRAECRKEWSALYSCWRNKCLPTDHFTKNECVRLFSRLVQTKEERHATKLKKDSTLSLEDLGSLNNELYYHEHDEESDDEPSNFGSHSGDESDSEGRYNFLSDSRSFRKRHEDCKDDWDTNIWSLMKPPYAEVMKRHFGLGVYASHTQVTDERKDTMSYIRLSGSSGVERDLVRRDYECYYETRQHLAEIRSDRLAGAWDYFPGERQRPPKPPYYPTENGLAFSVAMPKPLSEKKEGRFTRAIKVLALQPLPRTKGPTDLCANVEDAEEKRKDTDADDVSKENFSIEETAEPRPQLMVLMTVNDAPMFGSDY